MKLINYCLFFICIFVTCLLASCVTTSQIILTPEQQAVKILDGTQAVTLSLMQTHNVVIIENINSDYQARVRAVELLADVAQILSIESSEESFTAARTTTTNYYNSKTYKFWKKKMNNKWNCINIVY